MPTAFRVIFKSIIIEGFRSIVSPITFTFDTKGLVLVRGDNGVGKTTLFEALYWAIYGDNLKGTVLGKITPWKEVQGDNFRGTQVSVFFEIGSDEYQVVRCLGVKGMNDLTLVKNGEDVKYANKEDLQYKIQELIGMDSKVFLNSFLFGQRMSKMISAPNAQKRKLLEELFDMSWIDDLKKKVDEDLAREKTQCIQIEANLSAAEGLIGQLEKNKEDAIATLNALIQDNALRKEEYEKDILAYKEQIKSLKIEQNTLQNLLNTIQPNQADVKVWEETVSKYEQINEKIRQNEQFVVNTQGTIDEFEDNKSYIDVESYKKASEEIEKEKVAIKKFIKTNNLDPKCDSSVYQKEYEILEDSLEEYRKEEHTLTRDIAKAEVELNNTKESPNCLHCGQPLPDHAKTVKLKEKALAELNKQLVILKERIIGANDELDRHLWPLYAKLDMYDDQLAYHIETLPPDPDKAIKAIDAKIEEKKVLLDELQGKIILLTHEAEGMQDDFIFANDSLNALNETMQERADLTEQINEVLHDIAYTESLIEDKKSDIASLGDNLAPQQRVVAQAEQAIVAQKEKIKEVSETYAKATNKLSGIEWWSKKAFAANGLRAYVLKAMLEQLNQYTEEYSAKLGVSIKFSLDITKASAPFSTICSVGDRINKDYDEFSGGQQQRLDIVMMFAMHDLLCSMGNPLSIMILDEALDGLDTQGEADAFDLMREKSQDQAVYVITHVNTLDTLYTKAISIGNEQGKTVIVKQ